MPISPQQYNIRIGSFMQNNMTRRQTYNRNPVNKTHNFKSGQCMRITNFIVMSMIFATCSVHITTQNQIIPFKTCQTSNKLPLAIYSPHTQSYSNLNLKNLSQITLILAEYCQPQNYKYKTDLFSTYNIISDIKYPTTMFSNWNSEVSAWENLLPSTYHYWRQLTNKVVHATNGNKSNSNKGLRLATWNLGPAYLENKMIELESVIESMRPHLLVVSEANLKNTHDRTKVQIPGYELFTAKTIDNEDLNISRLVMYKQEGITAKLRGDLMTNEIDSIWLQLGFKGHKKILVGGLYRVWQNLYQADNSSLSVNSQLQRWNIFLNQWERAIHEGKETIVLGDLNLDWFSSMESDPPRGSSAYRLKPLVEELKAKIIPLGVVQCVRDSTRCWRGQSDSCLDLLFTNTPEKLSQVRAFTRGYSDHKLVIGTRFTKNIKDNTRYTIKRSYKNFDKDIFLQRVRETNMMDIYMSQDTNTAAEMLTAKINVILDSMAPIKKIQMRKNYAPWLTPELKDRMNLRDSAQMKAASTKAETDWQNYTKIRNKITREVKQAKTDWQKHKLDSNEGDPSRVWSNVLTWLNWSTASTPSSLYSGSKIENSPRKLANMMNQYYIQKVADIRSSLQTTNVDPLATLRRMMAGCPTVFQLKPVHPDTVTEIITNLKNSKACGLDNIDTSVLKIAKKELVPAITHIINLSITNAVFPNTYKRSKVAPLYKMKGDRLEMSSYRPVALLPIISKILERVIYIQTVTYMDTYRYLHPNHHGFRTGHSTTTALLQMYDQWMEAVDRREVAGVALVDMSAAFDCVDSSILLSKLEMYGFSRHARQWVWSYMTERTQVVIVDGAISSALRVDVGVPQGSILGPLFYVLYTNEIPEVVHGEDCPVVQREEDISNWQPLIKSECGACGEVVSYADDSSYTVTNKVPSVLANRLSDKYNIIAQFLTANMLKVNDSKTHIMMLMTAQLRRSIETVTSIRVGNEDQELSRYEKLLGLQVHENLKFQDHILGSENSLVRSLNSRINAIKSLSRVTSYKTRLMLAHGIFMSKLTYVISVWGGCENYLLTALQVTQNSMMRVVCKRGRRHPIKELLKETGWLSVRQLSVFHSVLQLKKTLVNEMPVNLHSRLLGNRRLKYARRITCRQDRISTQETRLKLTESSWRWRSIRLWQSLPEEIRNTSQLSGFKAKLRSWTKNNVEI